MSRSRAVEWRRRSPGSATRSHRRRWSDTAGWGNRSRRWRRRDRNAGGEGVRGGRKALPRALEGSDRPGHPDVCGRRRVSRFRHPIPWRTRSNAPHGLRQCQERGSHRLPHPVCPLRKDPARVEGAVPGQCLHRLRLHGRDAAGHPRRRSCKRDRCLRREGFPDEWKLHHQGGSIGYTGRDYRCHFETPDIVQENQAFTWNPPSRARSRRIRFWPQGGRR